MTHPADLGALPERAAESHPDVALLSDRPWTALDGQVRTVGELAAAVRAYADRLWAAGVRPGDTMAVVKANHFDIQALACAAVRIGAVPALLSVRMEAAELLACLELLQRPALLVDAEGVRLLHAHAAALSHLVRRAFSLDAPGAPWAPVLDADSPHRARRWTGDGPILVTHSSGTTGVPKLVAQSADSLYGHAAPQIAVARAMDVSGLSAKCLSFVHVRTSSGLVAMLTVAVPFLAITSPDLDDVEQLLAEHRPQALETHPNLFLRWEPLARRSSRPFGSVARFVTSFDAVHPRTVRTLLMGSDHADPVYLQAYGQTETGPITLHGIRRADLETLDGSRSRCVGKPFPGITSVRVVDEQGSPVPVGAAGLVEARTPGRGQSILGRPPLPGPGEWWPMGDVGRLREDGSLELLDRVADRADGVDSLLRLEDRLLDELPQLTEIVLTPGRSGRLAVTLCTADDEPLDPAAWARAAAAVGVPAGATVTRARWQDLPLTGSWKVRRHRIGER